MAAGALFLVMRVVREPALLHVATGLRDRSNTEIEPARSRRGHHDMTVITGTAAAEDLTDRLIGPAAAEIDRARIIRRRPPRVHDAGALACQAAQVDRACRRGRAVEGAQIRLDLLGLAMAQRAIGVADLVEGQAVAHRTALLHVNLDKANIVLVR